MVVLLAQTRPLATSPSAVLQELLSRNHTPRTYDRPARGNSGPVVIERSGLLEPNFARLVEQEVLGGGLLSAVAEHDGCDHAPVPLAWVRRGRVMLTLEIPERGQIMLVAFHEMSYQGGGRRDS